MKSTMLSKYNIEFVLVRLMGEPWKHCSSTNDTIQKTLGCFLSCRQKTNRVEALLKDIEAIEQGQTTDVVADCESVYVNIYKTHTEFYDIYSDIDFGKPDFIMPTADFKVVLAEWKELLSTSAAKKLPVLHSVWV